MSEHLTSPEKPSKIKTLLKLGGFALRHVVEQPRQERLIFTEAWWASRYQEATQLMTERAQSNTNRILLIIGAQHPLVDGTEPGEEFAARLMAGVERANYLTSLGLTVDIYIPGDRHMDDGVVDAIPLSEAGQQFVDATGQLLPNVHIHGAEINRYYKGDEGVYNGADEAFAGVTFFKDTPEFGGLEVITGPEQRERWELHAVANGALPAFHIVTPSSGETYHNNLGLAESAIQMYTRRLDPTWQPPSSFMARTSRLFRKPPGS